MNNEANSDAYPKESPSSPTVIGVEKREVTEIPTYQLSDSDEDRANALMKSMASQLSAVKNERTIGDNSTEPDIIEADPVQVVDLSDNAVEDEVPSVQVTFMNTDIGRKYRHDIEEFFHTLMTTEALSRDREPLPKIQRRPNLKTSNGEVESSVVTATTVIGSISVFRTYLMDRLGWPMIANMLNQTPGITIPSYEQIFAETFPPPEDAKILEEKPIKTSKKCFNCGEDGHEVRQCSKPFDRQTFNKNRSKFLATGLQYGRYHKEDRNRKMKPGELSDSLRNALGLSGNELPQHIYRMRTLGYPPGWLLHAEATNSGLAMFDKRGKEVDLDGDIMEDGQVPEHRIRDEANLKYNSRELISYPGFNTPCPEGIEDRALSHRSYPRMQSKHKLEEMSSKINTVQDDGGGQSLKRSRYDSASDNPKKFKSSHADMDLSDEDGGGDIEVIEVRSQDSRPEGSSDDDIQEYRVIDEVGEGEEGRSPAIRVANITETLTALEEQKQKLLAELCQMEDTVASSTPAPAPSSSRDSRNNDADVLVLDLEQENEEVDLSQASYQSKSSQVCTPVIQHSGISKLPSYDKFSTGINEHSFFENLPSATGTFAKMSGVLKDVKDKMATLRPRRSTKQ